MGKKVTIPTKDMQLARLVQACETGKLELEPEQFDKVTKMSGQVLKAFIDERLGEE